MPRKPRQFVDGGSYHLIARGNNRLFVFNIEGGCLFFKQLLLESKRKFRWKLSHYCLMANHVHLLGQIECGYDLPKLMQFLLFEYSRWYRYRTTYIGHLWQGRYKSPLVQKESYFLECGRYIERNPVRAKLVAFPEDYFWSSYRYYAFGEADSLIDEDPCYQNLGRNSAERQLHYKEFVKVDGPYDRIVDEKLITKNF